MRCKQSWNDSVLVLQCAKCGESKEENCSELAAVLESSVYPAQSDIGERPEVYALLVCDCANTISLMSRLNPNPSEKVYRRICAYLHDAQRYVNFSFINAPYNFGDIATKTMSNLSIWHSFLKTGLFFIGFTSRREYKTTVSKFARSLELV